MKYVGLSNGNCYWSKTYLKNNKPTGSAQKTDDGDCDTMDAGDDNKSYTSGGPMSSGFSGGGGNNDFPSNNNDFPSDDSSDFPSNDDSGFPSNDNGFDQGGQFGSETEYSTVAVYELSCQYDICFAKRLY